MNISPPLGLGASADAGRLVAVFGHVRQITVTELLSTAATAATSCATTPGHDGG